MPFSSNQGRDHVCCSIGSLETKSNPRNRSREGNRVKPFREKHLCGAEVGGGPERKEMKTRTRLSLNRKTLAFHRGEKSRMFVDHGGRKSLPGNNHPWTRQEMGGVNAESRGKFPQLGKGGVPPGLQSSEQERRLVKYILSSEKNQCGASRRQTLRRSGLAKWRE